MLKFLSFVTILIVLLAQCNGQRNRAQKRSTTRNVNATRLSIVVSGLEGTNEGTGTLLRPGQVPRIYAIPGRSRQYRVPFIINVNSIFIRSLNTREENRLCLQRNRLARLNRQENTQCRNVIRLNIPVDLVIPRNVESTAVEHENTDLVDPLALVNYGPNAYRNAPLTQDLYRVNYAVGDPIRARRVKRGPEIRFRRTNPLFTD